MIPPRNRLDKSKSTLPLGFDFWWNCQSGIFRGRGPKIRAMAESKLPGHNGVFGESFWQRLDPTSCRWCQNGSVNGYNYYPSEKLPEASTESNWAKSPTGKYNLVIREKLNSFSRNPAWESGKLKRAELFVDSAPWWSITLAQKAGNRLELAKTALFALIGIWGASSSSELIMAGSSHLIIRSPKEYCGTCTKCIWRVRQNAIVAPGSGQMARQCLLISRLTLKENIPARFKEANGKLGFWLW